MESQLELENWLVAGFLLVKEETHEEENTRTVFTPVFLGVSNILHLRFENQY